MSPTPNIPLNKTKQQGKRIIQKKIRKWKIDVKQWLVSYTVAIAIITLVQVFSPLLPTRPISLRNNTSTFKCPSKLST